MQQVVQKVKHVLRVVGKTALAIVLVAAIVAVAVPFVLLALAVAVASWTIAFNVSVAKSVWPSGRLLGLVLMNVPAPDRSRLPS